VRFAEPLAFLALILVPLVVLWFVVNERRRKTQIESAGDALLLGRMTGLGPTQGKETRLIETVLFAIAMALVAVALARPQFGAKTEVRKARGMDVVIALDLSRSMLAQDVSPSRLERAKIELEGMIKSLAGDRVGLVGFTSAAIPLCPMTVDHAALELQLRTAGPDAMPRGGTAIADAIEEAQRMLSSSPHKESGKAIIVVTDGEEHEGDPEGAARAAHEAGIEVHTVGVGSAAGEPIPLGAADGYLRDASGQTVISRLDEGILGRIAAAGGGISAMPGTGGGFDLSPVVIRLAQQNKADLEARTVRVYEERYRWALVPAFVLLLLATTIRVRRKQALLLTLVAPLLLGAGPLERDEPNVAAGNQALHDGKPKDAVEAYGRAQKTLGQDPRLLLNRGLAEAADGELDKAIESYKAAMAASPDAAVRAKAAYAMGNASRSLKKYDEAIQSYRRALLEDPTHSGARKNLELTAAMKRIQALQPKPPNKDGEKGDDKPNDNNADGGTGDGGAQDGGPSESDGGTSESDGGTGGDGSSNTASPDASGNGPEAGASGASGGDASPPEDAGGAATSEAKENEPSEDKDRDAVLDALEAKEKALQNKRRTKGVKPRRVEKDW